MSPLRRLVPALLATALLATALVAPAAPARAGEPAARPLAGLTFDRYYDNAALEQALRAIAAAYPTFARLESMGTSREGRPLWVLTLADPAGDRPPADRPAMYIDGNTHGNEVQGAEVTLFTAKYLLERRETDPWVAALLARVVFHLAPCVNPDCRERFLHVPNDEHSPRRVLRPVDDDRDGAVDEDGPDDLDGDGEILVMRVADENGDLVDDERDPRLMRARKPGERGRWRVLGSEGTDEDGDGRVNEDGPGGVDPNRNFPCEWRPEPEQGGAGPYPLSEPETRATAQFVLAHPRIAAVQSYHNAGRMILRPPAARTDREAGFPAEDRALYDELGKRGELLLPGYRYMQIREDLYRVHGGFVEWTAHALGVPSFTNELWGLFGWGTSVVGGDLEALRWNDVALHGAGFVRWKQARHPTLGAVELGGWRRFTIRSTPVDFLPDLCVRNALFTLEHAASVPDLAVRVVARARDGGVERLRVVVENRAMLPTVTVWAARHGLLPADGVAVTGARVLAAREVEVPGAGPVAVPVVEGVARLEEGVRGMASRTLDLWLAPDARPTEVVVTSRLGGVVRAAVK
ncbi:MAG: peptidase M14 [Planctomycetes bacterium]|nr:peptidase M14 [Planctomycetota bacterium]